jgi:hypothetical protein
MTTNWRPWASARAFARSLELKKREEWKAYCRSGNKPADIPRAPEQVYGESFVSWGDWLGTGTVANFKRVYRSFPEARAFVHTLGLQSQQEWHTYCQSGSKPDDIPATPRQTYRGEFVSMGDWLGTNTVADQYKAYRPFPEARAFAHSLGLRDEKEWYTYCKSGNKPSDLPTAPRQTYRGEFVSMGDWLGTNTVASFKRSFRPFEEARAYARSLGLKGNEEWRVYCQSGQKPADIPTHPDRTYKAEFKGWGDWLGTDFVALFNRIYRPFPEARAFVHTLNLKNTREWRAYCRSGNKPADIPGAPKQVYGEDFSSMGDWLGTGFVVRSKRIYRPFPEARAFVHALNLKNDQEWNAYCRSGDKPDDIPSSPKLVYGEDFSSLGDWLGTGFVATFKRAYRDFAAARTFVRTLGLKNQQEWHTYCQSGNKPDDIPSNPHKAYCATFRGMADWLGTINKWNRNALLALLEDLHPLLESLQERELYIILKQGGALPALRIALGETSVLPILRRILTQEELVKQTFQRLADDDLTSRLQQVEEDTDTTLPESLATDQSAFFDGAFDTDDKRGNVHSKSALPQHREHLHLIDRLARLTGGLDEEAAEYLVTSRVSSLWETYSYGEPESVDDLLSEEQEKGQFFSEIKRRFLAELEAINRLDWSEGWAFSVHGEIAKPNLMQRRIAWMVKEYRRVGNWSGTGSGKTISALLSSRICKAHLTLVITNYASIAGWIQSITQVYPDSRVYTNLDAIASSDPHEYCYLVLNYEKFQGVGRHQLVQQLLTLGIQLIVLDEVQLAKQRDTQISQRSKAVFTLLQGVAESNIDLRVLAMSATPVINSLVEAKRLLELATGVPFPDLRTKPTIDNALAIHCALMRYGFRFRPHYEQEMHMHILPTWCNDLAVTLESAQSSVLALEQALLPSKLSVIQPSLQPGTLLYTHYVEGMLPLIEQYLKEHGFSVGFYTGTNKSGLQPFLDGKLDFLIGSSAIGTGIDGLQQRCDRIILLSLPWTGAALEQIIGRVRRQGSHFQQVEVIVPQVVLEEEGERWSWDEHRWNLIHLKQTLSDCVLDGHLPATVRFDEQTLLRHSQQALQAWIERVKRKEMKTPLGSHKAM